MSNDILNINLTSDFQYTSASYKSGLDEKDLTKVLQDELLEYQLYFEQGTWLDSEIEHIREELINTGKIFARNQGFSDSNSIRVDKTGRYRVQTGTLISSIKAELIPQKKGTSIKFYNDANLGRGYYAGHIEYGFHDRKGNFVPARPFMRPALYAVAEGSKGNFRNILRGLLENLWKGKGFQGVSSLSFGRKSASPYSNFWSNKKNFSESLSARSKMSQLQGDKHRKWLSTINPNNKNFVKQRTGFRFASNKKDFLKLRSQSGIRQQKTTSNNKGKLTYKGVSKQKTEQSKISAFKQQYPNGKIIQGKGYSQFSHYYEQNKDKYSNMREAKKDWAKY